MDSGEMGELALGAALLSPLVGAAGVVLAGRRQSAARTVAAVAGALASVAAGVAGLLVLAGGRSLVLDLGRTTPFASWLLRVDPLGAYFLLVTGSVGVAASLYGLAYPGNLAPVAAARLGLGFNLFLLSLHLVVAAANAFVFLVAWELMAVTSLGLVAWRSDRAENRRAAVVYAVMTHTGTLCILASFLLRYRATGSLDFALWAARGAGREAPALRDAAFVLGLLGFGAKAGLVPLHIWLPLAHPVAPSHVSALMSGVMLKTAVYGFLRLLGGLGPAEAWWGGLVLVLAAVTALVGVIYALMEHDLKRLLAYHSVENVGIILLGVGAALLFAAGGSAAGAGLALAAALYHTWNHAVFKSLLFLGAGSVIEAVQTHDMERMGGLARRLPWTAAFFLAGAVAISGLPPFNGFASEWLTFQAILGLGKGGEGAAVHLLGPVGGAALALTGALAAACFVKAYGVVFLALPRDEAAGSAREAPRPVLAGMGGLAAFCLVLGLVPGQVLGLLRGAEGVLLSPWTGAAVPPVGGGAPTGAGASPWLAAGWTAVLNPAALAAMAGGAAVAAWVLGRSLGGRAGTRRVPTWACGVALTPRMEYTASAFAKPLRLIFRQVLRPRREIEADYEVAPYFACSLRYRSEITPVFDEYLYRPARALLLGGARRLRGLQAGSMQAYLGYMLVTLVALLVLAL